MILPFETLYQRENKKFHTIFYLRAVESKKPYAPFIKGVHRLILLGIFDTDTGQTLQWAYSLEDQLEIWREIMHVVVLKKERERIISILEKELDNFKHAGMYEHEVF